MMYTGLKRLIKQLKTLKESLIESRVGKIEKFRKRAIFRMSSFGQTEIEYFWYSNNEVRPLSSKEVLLKKNTHKL